MDWERLARRQVRRSADIIGLVILAELLLTDLIFPIVQRLPDFAVGSTAYELREMLLYLLIFGLPLLAGAGFCDMSAKNLVGTGKPSGEVYLMTLGLVLGWTIAAGLMGAGIEGILNQFGLTEISDEYILPHSMAGLAVQFAATAIIPPIIEEMSFRGLYLNLSTRVMGTWEGIALTSICFWLAHYSIEILPLAFGFGVIGGYIRRRYGSLLPSMAAHFAVNSVYMIINVAYAAGGDTVGTIIAMIVNLAEVLLCAVGIVLFIRRGDLADILSGRFGTSSDLPGGQIIFAVLTSIPALLALLLAVWYTAGNIGGL